MNTRDKNFTHNKVERRRAQFDGSVARYLAQLDTADRQEPSEELVAKTEHLKEKLVKLQSEMQRLAAMEKLMLASADPRHPNGTRPGHDTSDTKSAMADIRTIPIRVRVASAATVA